MSKKTNKAAKQYLKYSALLSTYSHRWGENPSARMYSWLNKTREAIDEMKQNGTWKAFCAEMGYAVDCNEYDCLA